MLKRNIVLPDVLSNGEISKIMSIDAHKVSTDSSGYCKANKDKYSVLINTWLYMWAQYVDSRAVGFIINRIRRNGLLSVIQECSTLASDVIDSDFKLADLKEWGFLVQEDPRITLQLLRYPKRFSPIGADKIREEGLKAFISLNYQLKGTPKRILRYGGKVVERELVFPQYLIVGVRDYVHRLLHIEIHEDDPLIQGRFSNGATAEGCHTMYEKYREFCKHATAYKDVLYPISWATSPDLDYVKAVAVPKSYKTPRIIAEVSAFTQYHMQGIRKVLVRSVETSEYSSLLAFDDQTINQEWSRLGSIYGVYCTIDLSSASDSISNHLAKQTLPDSWYRVINTWNPPFILANGKKIPRNIFLTSGSGETFGVESVIFLAIALYATEVVSRLTGEDINPPRVFGDDIICDYRVFDTLCDFLGKLHFSVNKDKSFSDGSYRESCGAEWWCGLDTSTKYFPRKAFDETSEEYLEGLVSLQHRLYEFVDCEQWLTSHIQSLYQARYGKEMTQSTPGCDCDDLWADFPYSIVMNPPVKRTPETESFLTDHEEIRREAHSSLQARKLPKAEWKKAFKALYGHEHAVEDDLLCELFRYVDFLQHGTPVDEFGYPIHRQPVSGDQIIDLESWIIARR